MPVKVLAGQIEPIISNFILSRNEVHSIIEQVSAILSVIDLAVLFAFGWLLVPYTRMIYSFVHTKTKGDSIKHDNKNDDNDEDFENTYIFFAVDLLKQIARLALLVYACDCVVVALAAVGYKTEVVSKVFAKIIYTSWFARRAQSFKRYVLRNLLSRAPKNCDKIRLVDRILDGVVLALLMVKILDYLSVETGMALGSIFAIGSTGTLIISLGSQEVAKGVVSGVEMAASDRFYEGDNVHFGDGTQGYIVKMGYLRTKIRTYDSKMVDIPNTQLGGQRVINISRTPTCRIVTTLRFEYKDVQNLPPVMESIKEEISKSCPKLIKEGKPFRVMISSFGDYHVEVSVNCSFDLPPTGEAFWANRQEMFLAIDRAVKKSNVEYYTFYMPT